MKKKQINGKKITTAAIFTSTRDKLKLISAIRQISISKLLDDFATKELEIEKKKGIKYLT